MVRQVFCWIHMKAIEEVPHISIAIEIQILERVTVSREERPDAQGCRGVGEPMSSASPMPCATNAIRRWMNAFIRISLISASA
jgi:hypothetical protein